MDFIGYIKKRLIKESRLYTYTLELLSKISSLDGIKLVTTQGTAQGNIGYFRYEKDGNLYEVEIRPIQYARNPIPEKLQTKKNTHEPLGVEDVEDAVQEYFGKYIRFYRIIRDSQKYVDIKMFIGDTSDEPYDKIMDILDNMDQYPVKFKLLGDDYMKNTPTMTIRYMKS